MECQLSNALSHSQSIDEFSKTHAQTLAGMEQLLTLLKSLRPAEADVELKKCAQLHTHVQRSIESAIEMGKRNNSSSSDGKFVA